MSPADHEQALRARLKLRRFPDLGGMRLWLAHPGSRLSELAEQNSGGAPYWGFPWPGGLALAHHILVHPSLVRGRRVLDYGAGCGIAGIAAHLGGAASVGFHDSDPLAMAAGRLNAVENGLEPIALAMDALGPGDIVVAGDVFYNPEVAAESFRRLSELHQIGVHVLIGDPFRPDLPLDRLIERARVRVNEVGLPEAGTGLAAGLFELPPG
jgi:predicted nicotinamide N-methyase